MRSFLRRSTTAVGIVAAGGEWEAKVSPVRYRSTHNVKLALSSTYGRTFKSLSIDEQQRHIYTYLAQVDEDDRLVVEVLASKADLVR